MRILWFPALVLTACLTLILVAAARGEEPPQAQPENSDLFRVIAAGERPAAELKLHNGAMTLFINGRPVPFTTFKATESDHDDNFEVTVARTVPDMAARGVHVFFVPVGFGWDGPDKYDFHRMDEQINHVLKHDPEAWVVIRIQSGSFVPGWWCKKNPDKLVAFAVAPGDKPWNPAHQSGGYPSLGSDFWDTQGIPAIKALVAHVLAQDYARRVIGYLPTAYNTNEWFIRSYDDTQVGDLCPAMQKAFAGYLHENYGMYYELRIPDRIERSRGDLGYFFHPDPRRSRIPIVAYYQFMNRLCAQTIVKICQAIRAAHAPQPIIVGTFYGYSQGLSNFNWVAESGHLDLARMLRSDGPDFTASPLEYFTRNFRETPGGGLCWSQGSAPDAALIAGKAYFGEDDFAPPTLPPNGWSATNSKREDAETLKRNFVFSLCKGQLFWWYDLNGHWYEGQERLDAVAQCVPIARASLERDRRPVAEVAVVMDEQASFYVTLDRYFQRSMFWENFYYSFAEIGAPVDLLLLSSLEQADLGRYKAIFFPTCFSLNNAQRRLIDGLKADGRTLVFYQADGLINPDADPKEVLTGNNMPSLAGFKVAESRRLLQMQLTTGTGHELLKGFEDQTFGQHLEPTVRFVVEDPNAEPLAYYSGRGPVGMARRQFATWTSIYTAVPVLPVPLVRNIIRQAGVHVYLDTPDIVYANRSYLGIFTKHAGPTTICLPRPARVREAFTGSVIAANPVRNFQLDAAKYHTYLFVLD